ncbi:MULTISPECIES: hypothetical protein [unclassified Streptomyces]|uniref:hypothetical protein n=1 Tax=unclassified Streptomyces TaxID=2593676 RepID=UPI00380E6F1F
MTSIVFAVLAGVQLRLDDGAFVFRITAATVLLGAVLHGVTAEPAAHRSARRDWSGAQHAPVESAR